MLGEKIRRAAFEGADLLKGAPVMSHFYDIKQKMESERLPEETQVSHILDYAARHTVFYNGMGVGKKLVDFPVVDKAVIREKKGAFCSDQFMGKRVFTMRTSGSTGVPFSVFQDPGKRNRCLAEMMYFWGLGGYRTGMKYAYFRSWNQNKKGKLTAFARNLVMRDVVRLDREALESVRRFLKQGKVHFLLGYASTFETIADYLYLMEDTPDQFAIQGVVAISESLSPIAREKLKAVFGCPVLSHYSNSENGVLAQECPSCGQFVVNTASFVVELLDFEGDFEVPPGEPGRIVVTDLYNHAMPMIRYDTGDVGIRGDAGTRHTMTLASVEGRLLDFVYDTEGRKLSPHQISVAFWEFPQTGQYRFIQKAPGSYEVNVLSLQDDGLKERLTARLRETLGAGARIEIRQLDDLPLLASGKRSYIVNHMEKPICTI